MGGKASSCPPLRVEALVPSHNGRLVVIDEGLAEAALLALKHLDVPYIRVPSAESIIAARERLYYSVGGLWASRSYDDEVGAVALLFASMLLGLPPKRLTRMRRRILAALLEAVLEAAEPEIITRRGEPFLVVRDRAAAVFASLDDIVVALTPSATETGRGLSYTRVLVDPGCGEKRAMLVGDGKPSAHELARLLASNGITIGGIRGDSIIIENSGVKTLASILAALGFNLDSAALEAAARLLCSTTWSVLALRPTPRLIDSSSLYETLGSDWRLVSRLAYLAKLGYVRKAVLPVVEDEYGSCDVMPGFAYVPCVQLDYMLSIFRWKRSATSDERIPSTGLITEPKLPSPHIVMHALEEAAGDPVCAAEAAKRLEGDCAYIQRLVEDASRCPRMFAKLVAVTAWAADCSSRKLELTYEAARLIEASVLMLCCAATRRLSSTLRTR